jgi:hypothetical protein
MPRRTHSICLATVSLFVLLAGCGGAAPSADEPRAASAELTTPAAFLERLRELVRAEDYDGVRALVVDYTDPNGRSVPDEIVDGIRDRRELHDYAFSPEGLDAAIARADDFAPPTEELAGVLSQGFGGLDPRLADPSAYLVLDAQVAAIVLARIDGQLRLVFWEDLPALARH